MTVDLKTTIEVDSAALKAACTPEELGCIFSEIANHFEEKDKNDAVRRRKIVEYIHEGLSENAKRMLAEVLALEIVKNSDRWTQRKERA